jgi:hypothetical protein
MSAHAQELQTKTEHLQLSPPLMDILRAEMREITGGVQSLPVAIASGDWHTITETSARIKRSYIMEQQLTEPQRHELNLKLPEYFKRLDQSFHGEAERLGIAATLRDPVLAAFHFSRLIEACTSCHAEYAPARFPGLAVTLQGPPRH